MVVLISYLIKLSISLAAVYLFYQVFLRRLTFYNWNRWYLLMYSLVSFIIPFVNVYPVLEKNNWNANNMMGIIPAVDYQHLLLNTGNAHKPWTYQDWSLVLLAVGVVVMLVRLLIQQLSFLNIRRNSTLLYNDKIKVYQVDQNIIPFSYGNAIFVNQHQHSEQELREIIRHEFIHVKQKHTIDVLWSECLCILNWYNPFAWLIRKSIRQNLEFIADHKVLQNGIDKKEYQYLLLKVIGVSQFRIATPFNFSSLKKRIAMMNKIKSAKVHLLKFLFMLPLMAVLLISFRNTIHEQDSTGKDVLLKESADPTWVRATDTVPSARKWPSNVSSMSRKNDAVEVRLKDGKVEHYDFSKEDDQVAFEKKYGKWASPPPPPPPPPARVKGVRVSPPAPLAPPTPPVNRKGYVIGVVNAQGSEIVIVKNKNNKLVKAIELNEWEAHKKENEAQYGEIPPPPPPPAPARGIPAPGADYGIISAPSREIVPGKQLPAAQKPTIPLRRMTVPGREPLYIIDGIKQSSGAAPLSQLDPSNIESITVLKDAQSYAVYGAEGANGAILITTKARAELLKAENELNLADFNGVLVLDGVVSSVEEVNKINPNQIESVTVLKNAADTKAYGEKGKNGVILIRTKNGRSQVVTSVGGKAKPMEDGSYRIFNSEKIKVSSTEPFDGIYVVDGKKYSASAFKALGFDPNSAKSVRMHKGVAAVALFGAAGANGVMEICTRPTHFQALPVLKGAKGGFSAQGSQFVPQSTRVHGQVQSSGASLR